MKIAIIGVGAVGGSIAARLLGTTRGELTITLVSGARSAHFLREQGLRVIHQGAARVYHPQHVVASATELPLQDSILLCTKFVANEELAEALCHCGSPATALFPLQNGLSKRSFFRERNYSGEVIDTVVRSCCRRTAPAEIEVDAWPSLSFGAMSSRAAKDTVDTLRQSGISCLEVAGPLDREMVEKLGFVVVVSAVTSLYEGPCSIILDHDHARKLFVGLCEEFSLFAQSHGHPIGDASFIDSSLAILRKMPPTYYSSMTVDLLAGKHSELTVSLQKILRGSVALPLFQECFEKLMRRVDDRPTER